MKSKSSSTTTPEHHDYNTALKRAAAMCARSEHAPRDIYTRLIKWGIEANQAQSIIDQLTDNNFLDVNRYACAFAKDKFSLLGWGRTKITFMLQQKSIPQSAINQAISLIDDETYQERLLQLLRNKESSLDASQTPAQVRVALLRYATSRGYELPLVYRCIQQLGIADDDGTPQLD